MNCDTSSPILRPLVFRRARGLDEGMVLDSRPNDGLWSVAVTIVETEVS